MSSNGETHFKNLAANAARFLKCVWPFYDIAKERLEGNKKKNFSNGSVILWNEFTFDWRYI